MEETIQEEEHKIIKQRHKVNLRMAKTIKEGEGEIIKSIKEEGKTIQPIKEEGKESMKSIKERVDKISRNLATDRDTLYPVCFHI